MSGKGPHPGPGATPELPASTEQPATDTSADWDESMERQVERPRPLPDVADEGGRLSELM